MNLTYFEIEFDSANATWRRTDCVGAWLGSPVGRQDGVVLWRRSIAAKSDLKVVKIKCYIFVEFY